MALISLGRSCVCSAQQDHHLPKPNPHPFSQTRPSFSLLPSSQSSSRSATHLVRARKGLSSRTRRLENRGKKGVLTTTPPQEEEREGEKEGVSSLEGGFVGGEEGQWSLTPMPEIQGEEPDFWEGPQWDALGFFVQYQWAFGVGFALIACGIAVATYNEGATDFKKTPVYKESIQSRDLLEEPEASGSDVFESNPTEDAPSLE